MNVKLHVVLVDLCAIGFIYCVVTLPFLGIFENIWSYLGYFGIVFFAGMMSYAAFIVSLEYLRGNLKEKEKK